MMVMIICQYCDNRVPYNIYSSSLVFIHYCRDNLLQCNCFSSTITTVNLCRFNIRLRKAKFFVQSNDAAKDFYIVKNCYLSVGQDRLNPHTLKFSLCGTNEAITDSQLFVRLYFFLPRMLLHFFIPVNSEIVQFTSGSLGKSLLKTAFLFLYILRLCSSSFY